MILRINVNCLTILSLDINPGLSSTLFYPSASLTIGVKKKDVMWLQTSWKFFCGQMLQILREPNEQYVYI